MDNEDIRHVGLTQRSTILCPVTPDGGICSSIGVYMRHNFPNVCDALAVKAAASALEVGVPYIHRLYDPGTLDSIIVFPLDMGSILTRKVSIIKGFARITSLKKVWGIAELAIQNDEYTSLFYDEDIHGVLNTGRGNDVIAATLRDCCDALEIPVIFCEDGC